MGSKHIRKVDYPSTIDAGFLGRNGYGKSSGIEIMAGTSEIFLTPFTSKGLPAKCEIRIPKSEDSLRALAKILMEFADEVEAGEM